MILNRTILFPVTLAAAYLAAVPARAEIGVSGVDLSASATVVSDYRFRGVSYSDLDPAVQADVTLETRSGLFASAWASTIADYEGSNVEVDLSAGWSGAIGPTTATAGVITYFYPGSSGTFTYELFGSLGMQIGPLAGTVGVNWAPGQSNLDSSSRYIFGSLEAGIPLTPFTVRAALGHERGGMVSDELGTTTQKLDWEVGVSATFTALTVGVSYVGNDLPRTRLPGGERANRLARDGVVFTATLGF